MTALICGSVAYDNIMVFEDSFKNHILPDQIHILNVAFLVPRLRREFGGCATNIAYNLKLLGEEPLPMATVGQDFGPYRQRLEQLGIRQDHVRVLDDVFTAQAFITTDLDDNQITAFHPGAMNFSETNKVTDARDVTIGMVSPDGRAGMIEHAAQFAEKGIPFIFDPGQGLPMFNGEELMEFIRLADYVATNDYEAKLLQERTGKSVEELARHVKAYVLTQGAHGSLIFTGGNEIRIPPVPPSKIEDPTGCGDAYRAGLLYGIANDFDWKLTGRLASLLGSIKIAHRGPQNHEFTRASLAEQFADAFEMALP